LHASSRDSNKQAFVSNKPSTSRWHDRLGHPALPIVERVLSLNKLLYDSNKGSSSICDSC
jgi:hypothetical protein